MFIIRKTRIYYKETYNKYTSDVRSEKKISRLESFLCVYITILTHVQKETRE